MKVCISYCSSYKILQATIFSLTLLCFQFRSTDNELTNLERKFEAEYTNVFEEKNMLKEDLVRREPV